MTTEEEIQAEVGGPMPTLTAPASAKTTGLPEGYVGPPRVVGVKPPRIAGRGRSIIAELVSSDGDDVVSPSEITSSVTGASREVYDITKETNTILSVMNPVKRTQILMGLKGKGIGYSSRQNVGNGFSDADRGAFRELLLQSNVYMRPWDETWSLLMSNTSDQIGSGSAKPIQVSAAQDLYNVVQSTAQTVLGRNISDEEAANISKIIQQAQVSSQKGQAGMVAGTVEQMAAPSTLAQQQIEQQYGAESSELQYMNYAGLLNRAVSGQ